MKTTEPISIHDIVEDLNGIGIKPGMNLMIHSSLSQIGWVIGGARTVVEALLSLVGETGTLVMPSATPQCLHPSLWEDQDIPAEWIGKIEAHLPVFEKLITPTTMGVIPETFRHWPKTMRSDHPISSICANGNLAKEITTIHNLELSEGPNTPYEKVYNYNFDILLLGVGFNRCTMLHFAESKSNNRRLTKSRYPIYKSGQGTWIETTDMGNDNGRHFPRIGELFSKANSVRQRKIGNAQSILFSAVELVNFGKSYFDNLKTR